MNLASHFVDRNVERGRAGRTALICGDGAVTYGELARRVDRAGSALRSAGAARGDRVLLALSDSVEFVACWYGAQKIGSVTAECYTYLTPKDYRYFVEYTGARVVLVDGTTVAAVREACSMLGGATPPPVLVGLGPGASRRDGADETYDDLTAAAGGALEPVDLADDEVALWKFTTGSTGAPKACPHMVTTPVRSFEAYASGVLGMGPDDRVLPVPKLFFGYSRDLAALFPFGVGASGVVFGERSTPERIFELIARHRPTILVNVPTMMAAMVSHPEAAAQDLSCLRLCTSAGEALPAELHRRWTETFGVEVLDGIGSSEAYHIYVSSRPGRVRQGTLGEAVPGYAVQVVDDSGSPLPDGEIGRLQVRGPTIATCYLGDPERTAATFVEGSVLSADLFVRDGEGYFSYRGRADDLLKVAGIWVAPGEIEDCLLGHEDVVACAVAGYEEAGLVRPRAFVVLREGVEAGPAPAMLQAWAKARLAPYKYPRQVRVVGALPTTANGKLDRKALREPAE